MQENKTVSAEHGMKSLLLNATHWIIYNKNASPTCKIL